ncbi:N-acetylmuramoyl-L-alanine amidase [Nocardiopsis valliformis]|uniref:N-acetylmuramoyl-L-alanine amidase n=1 Tax=Nocardiopsis valliformis TaxID=239974 RepID=UPI000348F0BA
MPTIVSRSGWGARSPRSTTTTDWSERIGFTVHYSAGPPSQTPRQIQDFHMDDRGWDDIGYNFLVDQEGTIYEGRGWLVVGAHAAPNNTSHIGVCFIGSDGDATPAAKTAIRDLYVDACHRAGRLLAQTWHSGLPGQSTLCPGIDLRTWTQGGMSTDIIPPAAGSVPNRILYSTTAAHQQALIPGQWTEVTFNRHHTGSAWQLRPAEPGCLFGAAMYNTSVALRVQGIDPGAELRVRLAYHRPASGGGTERWTAMPVESFRPGPDDHIMHTWNGHLTAGSEVRVEVLLPDTPSDEVTIAFARAESLRWQI